VAPEAVPLPVFQELFHTDSEGGGPMADSDVPPTPVTHGWLAGSSTVRVPDPVPLVQS
jgi:hypothetical protein